MGYEEVIDKIQAYSERVAKHYHPKMIVLYGSYARGTATKDSDIDLAVVCDSVEGDYLENATALFRLRRDIDLRIEPILIAEEAGNSFYREILRTGKVVYAASA